jgi:hypothetical protein
MFITPLWNAIVEVAPRGRRDPPPCVGGAAPHRPRRRRPNPTEGVTMHEERPEPSGRALIIFGVVMLIVVVSVIGSAAIMAS